MELCCGIVVAIIAIYLLYLVISTTNEAMEKSAAEKKQKEEAERRQKEQEEQQKNYRISNCNNEISNRVESFNAKRRSFFSGNREASELYKLLRNDINSIKTKNRVLEQDSVNESRKNQLTIIKLEKEAETFGKFANMLNHAQYFTMITADNYGSANKEYWNMIRQLDQSTVQDTINTYNEYIQRNDYENLSLIDPMLIPAFVWFYAIQKPYSAEKFDQARTLFYKIYKGTFTDITIAEFYAIKQMGGNNVLNERVRNILKTQNRSAIDLTTIASGLMWMNAYQEESMILQHMLNNEMQLTEKAQNRLHALSNGGGKAPLGYNVVSTVSDLFFDVSSIAWKDEDYTGLFENFAFRDKSLAYSLAVRDEDKEILVSKGIQLPKNTSLARNLNSAFEEEYGNMVTVQLKRCVALSGSGEERIDGILVQTAECKQMGLLVHIARIGKKLIIKFYTLFMPISEDLNEQKQQALSLHKKLSPTVTMWESSMKDTVLLTIQQLLNEKPSIKNNTDGTDGIVF